MYRKVSRLCQNSERGCSKVTPATTISNFKLKFLLVVIGHSRTHQNVRFLRISIWLKGSSRTFTCITLRIDKLYGFTTMVQLTWVLITWRKSTRLLQMCSKFRFFACLTITKYWPIRTLLRGYSLSLKTWKNQCWNSVLLNVNFCWRRIKRSHNSETTRRLS